MKTKKMLLLFFMFLTGVMNVSAQTPYAVFEPDPLFEDGRYGTLYLKADGLNGILEAGGTKVYYPPTASGTSWTDFQIVSKITSVVIEESFAKARPTSCSGWFSGMKNLNRIQGIEYLNTENVTNMSSMFNGCSKLTIPDLSGFNTANVTNMSYMFYGCPYPGNDWTTFNTGNVTKMHFMFGCTGLSAVYMSRLNLQKVTDMESMFDGCTNLETVNMSGCNTQNVTDMSSMFNGCSSLTFLNLSGFTFNSSTATSGMLSSCSDLMSLSIPATANYLSEDACTNAGAIHRPCFLIYPNGFTPEVTSSNSNYYVWKSGYFKDAEASPYAVYTYDNKTLTFYYDKNFSIQSNAYELNTEYDRPGWYDKNASVESVVFDRSFADARPKSCYSWFCEMTNLTSIQGIKNLNTSQVTVMSSMFNGCSSLTSLDVSGFNTAKVTSISRMFYYCTDIRILDLSSFTFKNGVEADLFLGDTSLEALYIPASANNLPEGAFEDVGTGQPVLLYYPDGFTPQDSGTPDENGVFGWKAGYFKMTYTEAYAVLSTNGSTLTFYYDNQKASRSGTVYNLNTETDPEWYSNRSSVTTVVFDDSFVGACPTSCYHWFYGMSNLTSITGIGNLKTDMVTDMRDMFGECSSLKSLDLSGFNTANVTDMSYMFYYCSKLTSLDLSSFTFPSSTPGTSSLLSGCSSLKALTVPSTAGNLNSDACENVGTNNDPCTLICPAGFTPEGAEQYDGYFYWKKGYFKEAVNQAYYTVSINNDPITASNYIYVYFYYDNLKDTRSNTYLVPTNGGKLNIECEYNDVVSVTFDSSFADYRPTNTSHWFEGLTLEDRGVEFNYLENLNTSEVTDMSYMFYETSATYLDLTHFDTSKATDMSYMLSEMDIIAGYDINEINLSSFTFKSTTNTTGLLKGTFINKLTVPATANNLATDAFSGVGSGNQPCKLICPDGFTLQGATQGNGYIQWKGGYFKVVNKEAYAVLSTNGSTLTFYYDNLKSSHTGTVYNLNTGSANPEWYSNRSSVTTVVFDDSFVGAGPTSCYCWFYGMSNLTSITGIGNLKTDNVKNMRDMFYNCSALTSLDVSSFNTANVTEMQYMFWGCSKLTSLDVSNFNTANVTVMSNMFNGCSKLASLDLSNFNTAKVIDMSSMFYNCYALTSLDLSNFNTAKVNYMSSMFYNCSALTSLDLSSFNTANVTVMDYMFNGCSKLTSLDLSSFTFPSPSSTSGTSSLLRGCSSLETLTIPSTAGKLSNDAFWGVGTANDPCTLICPAGFTPEGANQYDGYIQWKRGYFTDVLLGDANGDGAISVADVMITVCNVRGMEMSSFNQKNADVNQDGQITITDVMLIVKMVASGSSSAPRNAHQSMSDAMEVTAKGSELTLHLTGTGSYTASQMMLTLPEGCRLESAQMVSSRDNGHSVRINELGNGQYRVVIYGAYGMPFRNSCTDLVRLQVAGNHGGDVSLSDIQVVDAQTNTFLLSDVSGIATGIDSIGSDVSDDGDWYTIQGQKVATPTRGVYIRNGRKVVVR